MTTIAAIIVGIDGWEKYTSPLMQSIAEHEPKCVSIIVDNASQESYSVGMDIPNIIRTPRLCYSAAINAGKCKLDGYRPFDWYIVLSNDVLCTGPFADILAQSDGDEVIGPLLKETHGYPYIEGWCVAISRKVWDAVGGWDENYRVSSWEDVDFSTTAREKGFWLAEDKLPFVHLDQRQRFGLVPDYWASEEHNIQYFMRKHAAVTV